jgi:hypothetical protein
MMGLLDLICDRGKPKDPRAADALALRQLQGRGADLAQPRHVIHFLYFDRQEDARATAELAEMAGWSTGIDEPGEKDTVWTVRADGNRVVNAATVESFRSWFEHLAEEHGGEYDGWEASAKP